MYSISFHETIRTMLLSADCGQELLHSLKQDLHPNAPKPEPLDEVNPLVMDVPPDLSFLQQMVSQSSSTSSGPGSKKSSKGKTVHVVDKKPANAFFMFCQNKRQHILEQYQNVS